MKRIISFLLLLPLFASAQTPVSNNFQINAPKAIDSRTHKLTSGVPITSIPYASVAEANAAIALDRRYEGLTVCIGTASNCTEHWYHGGTANGNLIMKLVAPDWGLATTPLPVNKGGTGVTTPSLVAGSNVSITGTWPNQTISSTGGGGPGADSAVYQTRRRADSMFARQPQVYNVMDYGAIVNGPDNPTTRAANSAAILAAFNAAAAKGAGVVYFPEGMFHVNPLDLPSFANTVNTDTIGWRAIEFRGAGLPPFLYGTVGTAQQPKGGTIIHCPNQTPGESIFYQTQYQSYFSGCILKFSDMELRTYNQPQIAAIHAGWAGQLIVDNVQITTGTYSVQASVPNMNVAIGIVTPYINNNAFTVIGNVQVSGYYVGVEVNEHTYISYINLTCNLIGMEFKANNHASYITRATFQRNQIGVRFTGRHFVDIAQMNIEHPASSQTDANNAWQLALYDFDDPSNYAVGSLTWATTVGNVGPTAEFFKNGGANYCTHQIGTPPCAGGGSGVANPFIVGGGTVPTGDGIGIPSEAAVVKMSSGTSSGGVTNAAGDYSITNQPQTTDGIVRRNMSVNSAITGSEKRIEQDWVVTDGATNIAKRMMMVNDGTGLKEVATLSKLGMQVNFGFFYPPRMTATQAAALTPAAGACFFATTTNGTFTAVGLWYYDGSIWKQQ